MAPLERATDGTYVTHGTYELRIPHMSYGSHESFCFITLRVFLRRYVNTSTRFTGSVSSASSSPRQIPLAHPESVGVALLIQSVGRRKTPPFAAPSDLPLRR
jgi:hypothetical protein